MLAIVGEIVVVLLAAAAGAAGGWLFGRHGRDRVVAAARDEATAGTLSLADDLYARTQRLHAVEARIARLQEQLAGRDGALTAANERIKALENEAEVRARAFAALEHERARLGSRVGELVAEAAAGTAAAGEARAEIGRWRARLEEAEREFLALSGRIAELEPMLDGLHRSETALADAASRLGAAERGVAERAREIERLEGELAVRESQIAGLHERIGTLEPLEASQAAAMPAASSATRLPEEPPVLSRKRAANGAGRDDLKRIPGIGPATERILHSAGIFTFRQIANWRPEDLDAIVAKLGDASARLKHDAWIDGARREHLKKYGEAP
jgi:predicted flap endonuclease-1-like 5' DNA nuclease